MSRPLKRIDEIAEMDLYKSWELLADYHGENAKLAVKLGAVDSDKEIELLEAVIRLALAIGKGEKVNGELEH